jgi:2-iminobutanoate/2-iminopropanoate deaminase
VVAGDELDHRHQARVAVTRPQRADAFQRSREGDHGTRRQGHADVSADGRGVPDLEGGEQGVAALLEERHGVPFGRPPEGEQLRNTAGRGDLQARRRHGERRPAEAIEVDQRVSRELRLGEQPSASGEPGVATRNNASRPPSIAVRKAIGQCLLYGEGAMGAFVPPRSLSIWALAALLAALAPAGFAQSVSPNGVRTLEVPGAPAAVGTWSIGARAGDFIFVAGMQGVDPATNKLVSDPEARIRQAFLNIRLIAQSEGASLHDCVRLTIYVSDLARFAPLVDKIQAELWAKPPYPPRTMFEARRLFDDDIVEIDSVFYAPLRK